MNKEQLLAEAGLEDAYAAQAEAYMQAMERTTERTGGALGHLHNPSQYAGWQRAAAEHRKRAADLRAEAETTT